MAEPLGTVELLARELGRAFTPLRTRLAGGDVLNLLSELGLRFPPQLAANAQFTGAINTAATAAGDLPPLIQQLIAAGEAEDLAQIADKSLAILNKVRALIPAIDTIGTVLDTVGPGLPGMVAAEVTAFAAALPAKLVDYVLITYLEAFYPVLFSSLFFLGIAERTTESGGGDPTHPPFLRRELHLDRIADLFRSPEQLMRTVYKWGDDAAFTGIALLDRIHQILFALGVPAILAPADGGQPATLRILILTLK